MPINNIITSLDIYRKNGGAWKDESTGVFAGSSPSTYSDYETLMQFPLDGYTGCIINSAVLNLTRYVSTSSAVKTWEVRLVDCAPDYEYTYVDDNKLVFTLSAGAGVKAVDITGLMPGLVAAPSHALLFSHGDVLGSDSYAEIRPKEYNGGANAAYIALSYSPIQPINVGIAGLWKGMAPAGCRIRVRGAWKTIKTMKVKVNGVWKMVF